MKIEIQVTSDKIYKIKQWVDITKYKKELEYELKKYKKWQEWRIIPINH